MCLRTSASYILKHILMYFTHFIQIAEVNLGTVYFENKGNDQTYQKRTIYFGLDNLS